jgi:hypothetical protein
MLVSEYGLIPGVFCVTHYGHQEICDLHLRDLKEVLLREGLIRNFCNGEWWSFLSRFPENWHPRGKELLKKLAEQNRLIKSPKILPEIPQTDEGWCAEALASHNHAKLQGIIVTPELAEKHSDKSIVGSISQLNQADWWRSRGESIRLARNTTEYLTHLGLVLKNANSLMFIDPHLDPAKFGYREFGCLIRASQREKCPPRIEIHRVCYAGSGSSKQLLNEAHWRSQFEDLGCQLQAARLQAEVFVWDDFHDRYLISNLIGISLPNGYDVTTNQTDRTTWTRLSRQDRDEIQREFDPNRHHHRLQCRFSIGSS